jgi:hypothetical protein
LQTEHNSLKASSTRSDAVTEELSALHSKFLELEETCHTLQADKSRLELLLEPLEATRGELITLQSKCQELERTCQALQTENNDLKLTPTQAIVIKDPLEELQFNGERIKELELQYNTLLNLYTDLQKSYAARPEAIDNALPEHMIKLCLSKPENQKRREVNIHNGSQIFVACSNDFDGEVKGCQFETTNRDFVSALATTVDKCFPQKPKAMSVSGQYMSFNSSGIWQGLSMPKRFKIGGDSIVVESTVLVGPPTVLERYLKSRANERALEALRVPASGVEDSYQRPLQTTKRRRTERTEHNSDLEIEPDGDEMEVTSVHNAFSDQRLLESQ